MVEVTYQIVLSTLQTAGLLIGIFYYIMTLRNQQRTRELTLETRRLGLIENIASRITDEEGQKRMIELENYEWTDYADFDKKYGSENNPGSAAKRYAMMDDYNKIGMMLRKGFVEADDLYVLGMWAIPVFWEKYKPIARAEHFFE